MKHRYSRRRFLQFSAATAGIGAAPALWSTLWSTLGGAIRAAEGKGASRLELIARTRAEVEGDARVYRVVEKAVAWDPAQTAVVICDMWDKHHCKNATARVAELAPRVNELIVRLRQQGVLIFHCPSDTMNFYKDHPGRKLARSAPHVPLKSQPPGWCSLGNGKEPRLPIDSSDGGCDTPPEEQKRYREQLRAQGLNPAAPWKRQIETIEIKDGDAITDNVDALYLMKQRGITNVLIVGVHTNMCVLGRPFAIRQLIAQGQNVVLVRDLTDTMYNPARSPKVSHFTGTDLVVEHIEKHWCPTIVSSQLIGGQPLRFKGDQRKRLAIVVAEEEYHTTTTVPEFAARMLGQDFKTELVVWSKYGSHELAGLSALRDADVALLSLWRRTLPKEQLDEVRRYVASGKPLAAIRTSCHGFASRDGKAPAGHEQWPEFDREVLGCHYQGHYHHLRGPGQQGTTLWIPVEAQSNPILTGVPTAERHTISWLYRMLPLDKKAQVLMMGRVPGVDPEPVAWTTATPRGGRVFYTSLGHPDEFKDNSFQRLLTNGVYWAAGLPIPGAKPQS